MIPVADLRAVAAARLDDARTLIAAGRYDWAYYTCGYAVECALKARVATTLNWSGFPDSGKEFERVKSFKTHDLYTLLLLTGMERQVTVNHLPDWSVVLRWNPEQRYGLVGTVAAGTAQDMVDSTARLMAVL